MYGMSIYLIDRSIHDIDTDWWKKITAKFLQPGDAFEIRCWKEEADAIEQALCYGSLNLEDSNQEYETSIKGALTKNMIHNILATPQPQDDEMMTEFFTINVEPRFCSAHYGTELHLFHLSEQELADIKEILKHVWDCFSVDVCSMEDYVQEE
ncbi:hypothetical protein OBV_08680 [Oscillibacter valericigenes Sjm18-20]|nr:hypothetical protein OBV_08680 [Oscillibacter valericigenes Sjm18-20]